MDFCPAVAAGPGRPHCRFAVARTEGNLEIDSEEDLQQGHDP
jgi:hypothetical protein